MSGRRVHAAELLKLLESASQPLYVLDDSLQIVYLNEACRAWLGSVADDLLGQSCTYQSGEDPSAPYAAALAAAAGLCPPPAVLEGREAPAQVSYVAAEEMRFRPARFVPLGGAGGPAICIVAVVSDQDSAQPLAEAASPESDEPKELHLLLQQLRGEKRLLYRARSVIGRKPGDRRRGRPSGDRRRHPASVLVVGPPGSGRRHLAEAIHYGGPAPLSTLPAGQLLPLECGLLDAELLHATLRRTPTAASRERGTLLL